SVIGGVDCPGLSSSQCHRISSVWTPPNVVGTGAQYSESRVKAGDPVSTKVLVGATSTTTLVDTVEHPHGVPFTYFVVAQSDGTVSGSASKTITAVNDAPVANPDSYAT